MLPKDPREAFIAFILAATLIIIWLSLFAIRGPGIFYEPQPALQLLAGEDANFLRHAMSVEFPSPMDYTPIQEVCSADVGEGDNRRFRPGLVFSCEEQHGGVGMVRNQILKCVRFAIHAGAGLVIPGMAKRNQKDISDIETSNTVPLEYLFDREMFVKQLTESCPGMRLYNSVEDFPGYEDRVKTEQGKEKGLELVGDQFEPDRPREGISHPEDWREEFDAWLKEKDVQYTQKKPVHVKIGQAYLEYNVHSDSPEFVSEFGKLLSFRADTRALAARVLLQMKIQYGVDAEPTRPARMDGKGFLGAHLRLEKDAIEAWTVAEGWVYSERDKQFGGVWDEARRTKSNVIYVATGDEDIVDAFKELADGELAAEVEEGEVLERRNVSIMTKRSLLSASPHDLARLEAMTFDQQALVDFLIMFKSTFFVGIASSSFPWTVALRRHEMSMYRGADGMGYANEGSDILRDELSVILGERKEYPYVDPFEWGLWP
ncbi:uncharacterized protein RSE6_14600 [Rhynchosporium secalis]|uniref:Alternative oxidase n=1 Tax=Rhynchosporium secalis TaxID=38038 RepID=A0A1E1MVN0_RHYSE|nr:uncharacterized protein RSE6_14600 [Rhynchosporium secalis]